MKSAMGPDESKEITSAGRGAAPVLLFSDLDSGPNTGNSDSSRGQRSGQNGAIVTVWGAHLGDLQEDSQILCNGATAARVYFWGPSHFRNYQKISFQVDHAAVTGFGQIIVTVHGMRSNILPFTVRRGAVYFVSTAGADTNPGSFGSPWKTLRHARDVMRPGDVTYALNGVSQTLDDGSGWDASLLISSSGLPSAPIALVAYPGASVTIGSSGGPGVGIRTGRGATDYWVIANLILRGKSVALSTWHSNHWRIVGNDISCPTGNGQAGCYSATESSNQAIYANDIHDTGRSNASALYHAVYLGTDSNHMDFGWNNIADVHGCRGLQIHSTPQTGDPASGHDQYDLSIHDNIIHDTQCDGIVADTIDPSLGAIKIYNNVLYNVGKGPNNPEGTGAWNAINIVGNTEAGNPGKGLIEVFNNTIVAYGTFATPPYSGENNAIAFTSKNKNLYVRVRNNLIYSAPTALYRSGVPYFAVLNASTDRPCKTKDDCPWLVGSNNLLFGAGPSTQHPGNVAQSIDRDPLFVNNTRFDFHLRPASPARGAGIPITAFDLDGNRRPETAACDVGAYQFVN